MAAYLHIDYECDVDDTIDIEFTTGSNTTVQDTRGL
jgi:hypothetical protein